MMQPLVSAKCACSFRSPYGPYAQMTAMRGSDKGVELGGKKQGDWVVWDSSKLRADRM